MHDDQVSDHAKIIAESITEAASTMSNIDRMLECDDGNIANAIFSLSFSAKRIANAIDAGDASPGKDATGGHVASLTEAVMGVTAGLCRIASAIESLADAVREK